MTSNIVVNGVQVKPNRVTWKSDVNSFVDTCTIDLPRLPYLQNETETTTVDEHTDDTVKRKSYLFKTGHKVSVELGYDKKNDLHFQGYIKRVNMGTPVQLECEGFAYQLQDVVFNKTYAETTAKKILQDLIAGTDIVLSKEIAAVPLKNVRFKNASGIQVLEWLKGECKLAVYFNFNELYAGTKFGKVQERVKVRIGWNTEKDDDFKEREKEGKVNIVIKEKDQKGDVKKTRSAAKYSTDKTVKVKAGMPANFVKEIAERLQTKEDYRGYEGNIVLFLKPYVRKGMVMELDGGEFPEKSGDFFIESVSGDFGESGGRQTAQLGFLMQK